MDGNIGFVRFNYIGVGKILNSVNIQSNKQNVVKYNPL